MGQVNNVFLIVAITAIMAIATAVLAFFLDMLPQLLVGNGTGMQTAADAAAKVTMATRAALALK